MLMKEAEYSRHWSWKYRQKEYFILFGGIFLEVRHPVDR